MYIAVACNDPGIVQIVRILKTIFQMIQILGPVLAMASLGWIFFRNVTASEEKDFAKNKKQIYNCLIALVVTFFLPFFVNLTMSATFMTNTFEVSSCWEKADSFVFSDGSYAKSKDQREKANPILIDPEKFKGKGVDDDPNAILKSKIEQLKKTFKDLTSNSTTPEYVASSSSLKESLANLALLQQNDPSRNGGSKYWRFMGFNGRVAWCACFVSWCVHNSVYKGQKVSSVLNYKSAAVNGWISYCKTNKNTAFHDGGFTPAKGDLIFFDWDGGVADHIGIVYKVDDSTVYTIEGNSGDKVRTRQYDKNSGKIYGYCSW